MSEHEIVRPRMIHPPVLSDPAPFNQRPQLIPHFQAAQGKSVAVVLIELLVGIAIIAILAGMLLPALAKAKSKALQIQVINRNRQLVLAMHQYAADRNDLLPPNPDDGNKTPERIGVPETFPLAPPTKPMLIS